MNSVSEWFEKLVGANDPSEWISYSVGNRFEYAIKISLYC